MIGGISNTITSASGANRCVIVGGNSHSITTTGNNVGIFGGQSGTISGTQADNIIIGGSSSTISGTSARNCIVGGQTSTIDDSNNTCIAGGQGNTSDGNSCFVGGCLDTVTDSVRGFFGASHDVVTTGGTNIVILGSQRVGAVATIAGGTSIFIGATNDTDVNGTPTFSADIAGTSNVINGTSDICAIVASTTCTMSDGTNNTLHCSMIACSTCGIEETKASSVNTNCLIGACTACNIYNGDEGVILGSSNSSIGDNVTQAFADTVHDRCVIIGGSNNVIKADASGSNVIECIIIGDACTIDDGENSIAIGRTINIDCSTGKSFGFGNNINITHNDSMVINVSGANAVSAADNGIVIAAADEIIIDFDQATAQNMRPATNGTHDLGTSVFEWDEVWVQTLQESSDIRFKTNIEKLPYGLKEILNVDCIRYERVKNKKQSDEKFLGVSAQQIVKYLPEVVYVPEDEENDRYSVKYTHIIPVLIQSTQELHNNIIIPLQKENDQQKEKINQLESEVNQLESEVSNLKSELDLIKKYLGL